MTPTELRLQLLANDYASIPVEGKRPPLKQWEKKTDANMEEIKLWAESYPYASNTGILTAFTPTLDIDITNPEAAEAVEALAREKFEERGFVLVRTGQAPKRAIFLRTDKPFKKITGNVVAPNGDADQKIELLAEGQQVVAFGIHPKTQKPYSWVGGDPSSIKHEDLPYVSEADAKQFVADAVALLVRNFGYTEPPSRPRGKANGNGRGPADWSIFIDNIKRGFNLHDSLRDFAGTLIARGMPKGAVISFLQMQMCESVAPHDERWKERFDDIPRLVQGAVQWKAETEEKTQSDLRALLDEMNEKYAVVQIGGKTRVMWFEEDPAYPGCQIPIFQTITDFKAFHYKHKIRINKTTISRGTWWIESPDRRQYEAVVYAPGVLTSDKVYNLWRGFACEPREGDCSLFLEHVRENICRGNVTHYEYLLNKLAYGVQHPDRQAEVAVVLRGKEGVGKGKFVLTYGSLFGPHFKHISNPRHLVGNFNSLQHDCSVLFGDEVFFAGDRAHEGILKAIITEPTLQIERKGLDTFTARNRMHVFLSSNSVWVISAGADARRFFVLDVGDAHKQDHKYFATIDRQMNSGGREALLHLLLSRDVSGFEVRDVPQTAALADQKQHSRRGVDALIEHIASEGELFEAHPIHPDVAITSEGPDRKGFFRIAQSRFLDLRHSTWIIISRTLKEEWGCKPWKSATQRGIQFPPLRELRKRFEDKYGPQNWNHAGENWGSSDDSGWEK